MRKFKIGDWVMPTRFSSLSERVSERVPVFKIVRFTAGGNAAILSEPLTRIYAPESLYEFVERLRPATREEICALTLMKK